MSMRSIPTRSSKGIFLGIDPGLKRIGYGVIQRQAGEFRFLAAGLLIPVMRQQLEKDKLLLKVTQRLRALFLKFQPELLALEKIYFGRNVSSALGVSELRGVLLLTAAQHNIPVQELSPTEIKQLVCGYGQADKQSVKKMLSYSLVLPARLRSKDAVDALAIALAGCLKQRASFLS